tara:strand:+ start:605 stop:2329 length:1725 start_codon:yes stop_codon:yes gene_type:complete
MRDLYEDLDEKKSKRKKAGSESSKESSLRDWFGRKGAKGKKKGWVDCNAPDGKGGYKSCGRSGKEKRKKYPACRPTPGACKERGKGKSWGKKAKKRKNEEISMNLEQIVREELESVLDESFIDAIVNRKTHKIGKEAISQLQDYASDPIGNIDTINSMYDELTQIEKENSPAANSLYDALDLARELISKQYSNRSSDTANTKSYDGYDIDSPEAVKARGDKRRRLAQYKQDQEDERRKRKQRAKDNVRRGYDAGLVDYADTLREMVKEELEAVMNEKEGKKDACYHKVKSRYKVWPSAYASGALVKCRKVGAKNWGNSKKEEHDITIENEIIEVLGESHTAADEKTLKRMSKKLRASSELHAGQAKELEDIIDRSPNDELEESHSKKDEKTLEDIADQLKMASKMHAGQADKIDKIVSESNNSKSSNEKSVSEAMNCGCGQDPCKTYGKDNVKIIQFTNEETEKYLEESLYYGLIDEDEELEEAKKKKACKPSKGKKFARRVKGKCVSYGQAGKAKGGGARIKPGTGKGNAYCARSYGDMKSHGKDCSGKDRGTPLCLSRQKWKCSGKYSRKGK